MDNPESSQQLDAFLLYNGKEMLVSIIHARLRDHGLSIWFTQGNLKTSGASKATFDDVTFDREADALKRARVAVVFLGANGWGLNHKQNTAEAISQRKPLIRVLVGDPPREALTEFGGLFAETPPMQFRNPNNSQALDALVLAIQSGREIPEQDQPKPRVKPPVDADRILRELIDGPEDKRAETLDELAGTWKTHDLSVLAKRVIEMLPQFESAASKGIKGSDEEDTAAARAVLLSALVFAYDENNPDAETFRKIFDRFTDVSFEADPRVRWQVRITFFRAGVERFPASLRPDPDPGIEALFFLRTRPAEFASRLRAALQAGDWPTAQHYLSAVWIFPDAAFIDDICAALPASGSYAAFLLSVLSGPSIVEIATAKLQRAYGSAKTAEFAANAAPSVDLGRYSIQRIGSLLARMDAAEVRGALRHLKADALLRAVDDILGRLRIAGYASDTLAHTDSLGIATEVQTLCTVMLSTDVEPPLSIGLFGDWGTGKSFFMEKMFAEVERMKKAGSPAGAASRFHSRVAQIKFNAWHYVDSNLWASLVSHIIEELANQVNPKDPAATRKMIVSKLETAKEIRNEAQQEMDRAKEARGAAEINLSTVAKERADRQVKLHDLRATDFWKLVQDDKDLKKALTRAAKELGLPETMNGLDDLQAALTEAHSMGGRIKAVALSLANQPVLIALVLLLLFCVPEITRLLNEWQPNQPLFNLLATLLPKLGAAMTVYAAAIRGPLKTVTAGLDRLEQAKKKAVELIAEKRKEKSDDEKNLEKEVNELRAREASATQQLTVAEARLQETQTKLDEIDEGRSLAKYLLQRFQAEDYRKYLGLVSTVRRDFEKLSGLLRTTENEPIRRIILYIDDLDRCSPQRVLEVLQAVHLLLAFELFVVVVGVDPRWLLHSLEKSYWAFRVKARHGQQWITTPQNYLEKIFQIPYSLRPMQPAGFSKLIKSLLPATVQETAQVPAQAALSLSAPASGSASVSASGQSMQTGDVSVAAPLPDSALAPSLPPNLASSLGAPVSEPPPPLDYDALLIQPWESEFAAWLFEFIPSPRAAKRFTNIYRLLKAPLNSEALKKFEGLADLPGDSHAAMILLAILTGFPDAAAPVFSKILEDEQSGVAPATFFGDPAGCCVPRPDRERFRKCFAPLISNGLPVGMEGFVEWVPKVSRFSFGAAKIETDFAERPLLQK